MNKGSHNCSFGGGLDEAVGIGWLNKAKIHRLTNNIIYSIARHSEKFGAARVN